MARIDTNRIKIVPPQQKTSTSGGADEKVYAVLGLLVGVIALVGVGYSVFGATNAKDKAGAKWDLTPPVSHGFLGDK